MASHRRGPWSQGEDAYLVQLVHTQGALNWVRIAHLIGSRSPKQCRERYHQNLKPSLNHEPISPEEGLEIERLVGEMGKRWAEIARRLRGRSDNAVKNWWNGSMNRRRRLVVRRRSGSVSRDVSNDYDDDHSAPSSSFAASRSLSTGSNNSQHRPMLLTGDYSSHAVRHHIDQLALPSPSTSVISRADSIDGAPSLISDSGSATSYSPRGAPSPSIELPPLSSLSSGRHLSNPSVYGSPTFTSEADAHRESNVYSSSSRLSLGVDTGKTHAWSGLPTPTTSSTSYQRHDAYYKSDARPQQSYFDRMPSPQMLSAPSTPAHLPSLHSYALPSPRAPVAERKVAQDSRMNLSTLLG